MALDPRIPMSGGLVPDLLQAASGGLRLGQEIRNQPLRRQLMQAQIDRQNQVGQLQRDRFIGTPQRVTRDGKNFLVGLVQSPGGGVELSSTLVEGDFISTLGETAEEQTSRDIREAQARSNIAVGREQALVPVKAEQAAQIEGAKLDKQIDAAARKQFTEQLGREGAKIYSDFQKSAQQASAFIPRLASLRDLANKVNTGVGAEIKLSAKKALGIDSADMEELNAKLGELAQDILNQQTGTKTDFDFQNAVRQSAALGKTREANVRLIDALIERQLQAVNFGDQAREAYSTGGVKGVLDMRFNPTQQGQLINGAGQTSTPSSAEPAADTTGLGGLSNDELLNRLSF